MAERQKYQLKAAANTIMPARFVSIPQPMIRPSITDIITATHPTANENHQLRSHLVEIRICVPQLAQRKDRGSITSTNLKNDIAVLEHDWQIIDSQSPVFREYGQLLSLEYECQHDSLETGLAMTESVTSTIDSLPAA
jgi:hypothetical protein